MKKPGKFQTTVFINHSETGWCRVKSPRLISGKKSTSAGWSQNAKNWKKNRIILGRNKIWHQPAEVNFWQKNLTSAGWNQLLKISRLKSTFENKIWFQPAAVKFLEEDGLNRVRGGVAPRCVRHMVTTKPGHWLKLRVFNCCSNF